MHNGICIHYLAILRDITTMTLQISILSPISLTLNFESRVAGVSIVLSSTSFLCGHHIYTQLGHMCIEFTV